MDDAKELYSAAGGTQVLTERAAEPVVAGSRNSEEAVWLERYKPAVRAVLEIASQEDVERQRQVDELAPLRSELKYADEIAVATN